MYRDWIQPILLRPKCNVLATAIADPVAEKTDEKESLQLFATYGYKPGGQKHLAYQFHTVLLLSYDRVNQWTMSTPKDRERTIMQGTHNRSFTRDYLMNIAGWKLQ